MSIIKTNRRGAEFPTLLSEFFDTDKFFSTRWLDNELEQTMPAVNIRENGKEFIIELAAPGFSKNDFKVNIENDLLNIRAEKKLETKEEGEHFTRKEFTYNSFSRSFTLPGKANAEKLEAKYADGILKLMVPKKEVTKSLPKKEIKVD